MRGWTRTAGARALLGLGLIAATGSASHAQTPEIEKEKPPWEIGAWVGPFQLEPYINPGDPENDPDDFNWAEFAHMAVLPPPNDGFVLLWNRRQDVGDQTQPMWQLTAAGDITQSSYLWHPNDPNFLVQIDIGNPADGSEELFCGGHTLMADGRPVVFGGVDAVSSYQIGNGQTGAGYKSVPWGTDTVYVFDNAPYDPGVSAPAWHRAAETMDRRRYYAAVTKLDDGRKLITGNSGEDPYGGSPNEAARKREEAFVIFSGGTASVVFDPDPDGLANQLDGVIDPCDIAASYSMDNYARLHLLGNPVDALSHTVFRTFDPHSFLRFDRCPADPQVELRDRFTIETGLPQYPEKQSANSVHILWYDGGVNNTYDEVIYAIGGTNNEATCFPPASKSVLKMLNPGLGTPWVGGSFDLSETHQRANAVILLDGSILEVGGYGFDATVGGCVGRLAAERFEPPELFGNPNAVWEIMDAQVHDRRYHGLAAVHPSGVVISAGGIDTDLIVGEGQLRQPSEWSIEIYRPPYLFSSDPTPRLTSVPAGSIDYGAEFTIEATLHSLPQGQFRVALLAPGSVTHAFDFHQRYIVPWVTLIDQPQGINGTATIRVIAPPTGDVAPPGPYMLTVVNEYGIPSAAQWITLTDQ